MSVQETTGTKSSYFMFQYYIEKIADGVSESFIINV